MKIRLFFISLIMALAISNVASANEIDCSVIKPNVVKVASIDCLDINRTSVKPAEVNVKEPPIIYVSEGYKGIYSRINNIRHDIKEMIDWAADKVGLSSKLLKAVVSTESAGNQAARSTAGAIGIMQLMPSTAKSLGVNPYDPRENVLGGATYLKQQLDRYQGSIPKALAAYNAGPGAVDKYNGVPPYKETKRYVNSIMASLR